MLTVLASSEFTVILSAKMWEKRVDVFQIACSFVGAQSIPVVPIWQYPDASGHQRGNATSTHLEKACGAKVVLKGSGFLMPLLRRESLKKSISGSWMHKMFKCIGKKWYQGAVS